METQIYKVRDPQGNLREIRGPVGASDDEVIAQAQRLFAPPAPAMQAAVQLAPSEIPGPRRELTTAQRLYQAARPYIEPIVTTGGAIGGGLLGGAAGTLGAGPVGTTVGGVAGAGLGYGIGKEAIEAADVLMGMKPPRTGAALAVEPVRNVLEGAAFEAGGQVAGQLLGKGIAKAKSIAEAPTNRAATLARNALAGDIDQAVNALRAAPPGASVAEATAKIKNPAWQALVRDALESSPAGAQYLGKFATMSEQEGINALARLAGGTTAAETRGTTQAAKTALNTITGPMREQALSRANLGKAVAEYEAQAGKLSAEAAAEVQRVRDLINAGDVAQAAARLEVIKRGIPVGFAKYTYAGELAKKADEWASQAATGSLDLGQGARFAKGAADALRSVGIKPLRGDEVIASVRAVARNPEFAGNDLLIGAVNNVADDIAKWTSSGGVIDALALDAIRKNSVNAAIQQLRPGVDASTQRNLAAEVMTRLKPTLIDAIEAAGGTGYRDYLARHAKGMQQIAEKKLTGEALRLWKTDKDAFVRLVQNESPDVVEKFLGPGKYDIAKELSDNTLTVMRGLADKHLAQQAAADDASKGMKALATLVKENSNKISLPSALNFWRSITNKTVSGLEDMIGRKSMKVLAEAMQTPGGAERLLERLPAEERATFLRWLTDPASMAKVGGEVKSAADLAKAARQRTTAEAAAKAFRTGVANRLIPEQEPQNALVE